MSKLQTLIQFWQTFGLSSRQQEWDNLATEITNRLDDSDVSRKALIELIRDFKRDNTEEVRAAVGPLIKAFQNEVDAQSKRSNSAEKAFFDVYKRLVDVADPTPILEQTAERLQKQSSKLADYEIEVHQLRETLHDYNVQMQELKSKEKKLSELQNMVAQYDKNIDETLNERLKVAKAKLEADFNERVKLVEDEKELFARRLSDQEKKLQMTQHQLESVQSELFQMTSRASEKAEARSDEVELLLADLEASQQRAAMAEREADTLKDQIRLLQSSDRVIGRDEASLTDSKILEDLNCQLAIKDREVSQLISELQEIKDERKEKISELEKSLANVESEKSFLAQEVEAMSRKLDSQADYETIKRDLAILKSLEFSSTNLGADDDNQGKPLEVMILERSKVLQSDNTRLRMDRDKLSVELERTTQELAEKTSQCEYQASLITELEEHVEKLQDLTNSNRGEAEGRSSTDFLTTELDIGGFGESDSPVRVMSRSSMSPLVMLDSAQKTTGDASLLPIVQAQRERFKKRNEELEEERVQLSSQLSALQSEVSDLQADNVKLYEKIRFLQGFQGSPSSRADSVAVPVETKYKQHYEKKLDPFSNFSYQEKQRRYSQLNIVEKVIYSMVQFMLSNKFARIFVFVYAIILHFLVFAVLMNQALSESYKRDLASSAEWQQRYIDHMQEHHGDH